MSFSIPKTFMVLLLSLIFVGQAMASSLMPYHMMNMTGMNAFKYSQMTTIKHHQVARDNNTYDEYDNDSDSLKNRCCASKVNCNFSGCASIAGLVDADISTAIFITFTTKIHYTSNLVKSQNLTSLYRPPILS